MMKQTIITFPELTLLPRDAHKIRGYFGNLFKEFSPILHNHLEGGELNYKYPLVQYKVVNKVPTLVGLLEGAELLMELFMDIRSLEINGKVYPLYEKNITISEVVPTYSDGFKQYTFKTWWMALNKSNYDSYKVLTTRELQKSMLEQILRNQLLASLKGMEVWLEADQRIMVEADLRERTTQFKNQRMLVFEGQFATNLILPKWIGIGKSVSRGFGTIEQVKP